MESSTERVQGNHDSKKSEGLVMEEKENPPVKHRKLKKWDEYKDKIPLVWRLFQREIKKGTDSRRYFYPLRSLTYKS